MLTQLSKDLELSEVKILDESIPAFLERELRNASVEITKLKHEFDVETPNELKQKIESGRVEEHPAWEQLIYWENLSKKVKAVSEWMQKIPMMS